MKAKINIIILILMTTFTLAATVPLSSAHAADGDKCASNSFLPRWNDGKLCDPDTGGVVSPASFNEKDTAKSFGTWATILGMNIVTIILTVVGYVSLGYIIYGGFKFMTSGDSSSGVATARKTITNAIIGLILSIMSVAIIKFIGGAIV